jgi:hypothetical protein
MSRLRVRELHREESLSIHAVESIDVQRMSSDTGYHLFAQLAPVAVIVFDSGAVKAFNMAAEEIDFPRLTARVPELAAVADKVSRVSMSTS